MMYSGPYRPARLKLICVSLAQLGLASSLMVSTAAVHAALAGPCVDALTIQWPDDGWYQVQDAVSYESVCEGGRSCSVNPGIYNIINHTNGERFTGIAVNAPVDPASVSVSGLTISWPDDGWYQVQNTRNYATLCEGGRSCSVNPGSYIVINHTSGQRFENVQVHAESPDSAPAENSDSSSITVSGNLISLPDDGWYQVQDAINYASLCEGVRSCEASAGSYIVINHTTGMRWPNISVLADPDASADNPHSCPADTNDDEDRDNDHPDDGSDDDDSPIDNDDPLYIEPDRSLSPLPNPPLSAAPGAGSEPVIASGPVSTVTEFPLLRNPPQDLQDNHGVLSEEDFAAGPLAPVIHTPADVNTSLNSPPYFENLSDIEVFAGDEVNVLFRPLDADGGVPGLFPNAIPEGAAYVDNLDGTRSLIWRPLQPQVGITEFTITATDPAEPFYRTERTIRIMVKMPGDPNSIINLPPTINLIRQHTVRVGDPVVSYIKVNDPNGTIPTLEILNPPAGATLVSHHREPEISILHFIPNKAENISLNLRAIDTRDESLRSEQSVSIRVRPASDFDYSGERLRDLADARNFLIGYASPLHFYEQADGALFADIAAREFNLVTSENSLKWDLLNPLPGKYRWAEADNLVQTAKAGQQTVHGHTLVWHEQLPAWIKRSAVNERETHMREFIDRVLNRYAADITIWDVVNEALDADGKPRQSIWHEAMGIEFINIAFRQARASAPDATLLYNDYDISFAGPKAEAMLALMQSLKDAHTPIDGVGFQMHLDADFDRYDELDEIFNGVAALDLDIYITELDVSIRESHTQQQQATVYQEVLSRCLSQARCKAYQSWGFTDMYSWRREYTPLLLDKEYQLKPAYLAIQERLGQN